ncbi:MAG TPA: iron ABC transporter permease [Anaerolineaceae bacterium]|nr:iron ABC transporter permease [Anaerolineaceae bacterium]
MSVVEEAVPARRRIVQPALLLWIAPLAFLAVFFFQPVWAILRVALIAALERGLSGYELSRVWDSLSFTVWQALLSTLLTLVVGLPAAYVFGRYLFPGKSLLRVLTTLPFMMPTVVVAASFNAMLGSRGWLNQFLMGAFNLADPPLQIVNTLGAILLAHVFYNTTIVLRVVGGAWAQLDPRIEQAARVLGAPPARTLREVTLPLLRPAILSATLLVFLFDFTSFAVILLLGGPRNATLEVEIYVQALNMLNLPLAGLLSMVQMVFTIGLTVLYARIAGQRAVPLAPRLKGEGMAYPETARQRLLVYTTVLVLVILLVLPLVSLAVRSVMPVEAGRATGGEAASGLTLAYYRELFINRRGSLFYVPPIAAARNSLIYAGATMLISVVLGFFAAYALARPSRINRLIEPVLMLPLGTSAVTLGLGFILVFTRPPFDVRSFPALIPIAHSLVALPFVVRTIQPAIAAIPGPLRQAAAVLGASPLRVWWEIDLPIIARAALVGAVFSFTISLGEFGATTFLARPEYPTLPVAIYRYLSQPGSLNYGAAIAMSTLLMLLTAAGIVLMERLKLPGQGDSL